MTVIGVTGPSGAGKGAVSEILSEKYGFSVIDADKVYHAMVSSPSSCLDEIIRHFGNSVIGEDGGLDRQALSKLVFGDENRDKLTLLNSITHKYVVSEINRSVSQLRQDDISCVIDAPLLIEAGLDDICDLVISVLADKAIRIERIALRDGISVENASLRVSSQKNDDFYIKNCDVTVYNNSDASLLEKDLSRLLSERRVTN